MHRISATDAVHIERALDALAQIGLRPTLPLDRFKQRSEDIADENAGTFCGSEPTAGDWALLGLSADPSVFANAINLQDHCFDVAMRADLVEMIRDIVGLAAEEWAIEDVEISGETGDLELGSHVDVQIIASPGVPPFRLLHDKDFDWTLICRLNERLPQTAQSKFAIFLDGDATIVFLTPDQIANLNNYSGLLFFSEDEPAAM